MDGYIKKSKAVDVIVKYPYDIAGKTATAIKMIEDLPSADVVPKSEVEALKDLNDQLECDIVNANMNLDHMTKEVERLTVELKAMRCAANSYKMHYEQAIEVQKKVYRLTSEIKAGLPLAKAELAKNVASEIFAEIKEEIKAALESNYKARSAFKPSDELYQWVQGKIDALCGIDDFIDECEKKYIGEKKDER